MLTRAAKTIGGAFRALRGLGARAFAITRRVSPATALVFAAAVVWLLAAGWWNYVRPRDFDAKAYERYQEEEVARCRELTTSEARYDCVASAMIRRDHANFGTAMLVFLPPILLVFGRYLWREVRAGAREREHARLAELHARQHLSRYRREMLADRAAAQATRALLNEEARLRRIYDPRAADPQADASRSTSTSQPKPA
jgi:hypothetical protein